MTAITKEYTLWSYTNQTVSLPIVSRFHDNVFQWIKVNKEFNNTTINNVRAAIITKTVITELLKINSRTQTMQT